MQNLGINCTIVMSDLLFEQYTAFVFLLHRETLYNPVWGSYCNIRHEGDLVTFVDIMSAKNSISKYGRDVVTFVTNKIIKNKNFNYLPK